MTRHAVWLDPDEKAGHIRARCSNCTWAGTLTESLEDANAEADGHETVTSPEHWALWHDVGPYPGAPRDPITDQAYRILHYQLTGPGPVRMATVSDGVSCTALARRGLAVKVGRGWQRTRRGTEWAKTGRKR